MKHQFKYKDENNDTDIMFEACDKTQCQKHNLE